MTGARKYEKSLSAFLNAERLFCCLINVYKTGLKLIEQMLLVENDYTDSSNNGNA